MSLVVHECEWYVVFHASCHQAGGLLCMLCYARFAVLRLLSHALHIMDAILMYIDILKQSHDSLTHLLIFMIQLYTASIAKRAVDRAA